MGEFLHFTSFGAIDREEKLATRSAAFARSMSGPSSNCTQHARGGTGSSSRSGVQFNLDEVGISDSEDRQPKKVLVPRTPALHFIHHRFSRSLKHIPIVACISASETCLTPSVVTSQDSAAVRRDLEAHGTQIGRHLILKHRDKPYVNAELFEDYLCNVFLAHLMITRIVKDLGEEDAVLLMEDC
jgi:hypothetical protein